MLKPVEVVYTVVAMALIEAGAAGSGAVVIREQTVYLLRAIGANSPVSGVPLADDVVDVDAGVVHKQRARSCRCHERRGAELVPGWQRR